MDGLLFGLAETWTGGNPSRCRFARSSVFGKNLSVRERREREESLLLHQDTRTAITIQRTVDDGPQHTIALLPAEATSYIDRDIQYDHHYSYSIESTNEAQYGYPPKMPPPPDRLGNFLP